MNNIQILEWNKHPVHIERKRVKNLTLKIVPPGELRMSVPLGCSEFSIREFLQLKAKWIETNLAKVAAQQELTPDKGFDGNNLWLFGKCLKVIFKVDKEQAGKALLFQDGVVFKCKRELNNLEKQKAVREFYELSLKQEVEKLFAHWEPILGYYSSHITIREAKTRWGSCNVRTKAIMINRRLVYRPVQCLEYVVVHELAHLYEASHGPRFKAFLDTYLPDWRARRELLNNFSFKV